jgi:hypothetical protein
MKNINCGRAMHKIVEEKGEGIIGNMVYNWM